MEPHLVAGTPARVGSVPEIMALTLEPARDERLELEDVFKTYLAACKSREASVLAPEQFIDPLRRFCREYGIATQTRAGNSISLGCNL